jgi:hypothetical protein
MDEQHRVLPKKAVINALEQEVDALINELENDFIPILTHGEAKRLLKAVLKYPKEDADFTSDRLELQRAFSASKRLQDALTGLAVEVVIERMIASSQDLAEEAPSEGAKNE